MEELVAQGRCANIHVVGVYCPSCDPDDISGGNTAALSGSPDTPTYKRRLTIASRTIEVAMASPVSAGGGLHLQSKEMIIDNTTEATPDLQQENVGFMDENAGAKLDIPAEVNYVKFDTSQNIELGDFLSRPVLIWSQVWPEASAFQYFIQPWDLYFDNAVIKRKLDNYYMLRCNLHVKIVINASPFYYGAVCCAYNPLPQFETTEPFAGSELISLSQRPNVWIYPQNSQGGEMVLPFVYHKAWIDCTSQTDVQNIGQLNFESAGILRNANSVTLQDVDVQVYAWATDLELAGPTVQLSLQSKSKKYSNDEYETPGAISKTASAIARYADDLSSISWLSPYATATSYASGAIAKVASIFGYTRVPNVSDVDFYRPTPLPHMASTDIGEPIEKLTLDAKNELSIDSKICGVDIQDELMVSNFVTRESYLTSFIWSATDTSGTDLFNMQITPHLHKVVGGVNEDIVIFTPMSYIEKMFSYWRGDIIVRLKFLCSKYHKGRLQLTWDPHVSNWGTSLSTLSTSAYNQVIDLSVETDVEIVIPYTQPTPYLPTRGSDDDSNDYSSGGSAGVRASSNGNLLFKVLNQQTSPVASADISVLVFVRGAENLEFATPRYLDYKYSPYIVQSRSMRLQSEEKEYQYEGSSTVTRYMGVSGSTADPCINLVHMGETTPSLRVLLHRTNRYLVVTSDQRTVNNSEIRVLCRLPRQPLYPGFDPNGVHSAAGITVPSDFPYNFVNWSAMNWLALAFVGQRGSIDYYARPVNEDKHIHLNFERIRVPTNNLSTSEVTTLNPYELARNGQNEANGSSGLAVTHSSVNACCSASFPLYSRYKFINNDPSYRTLGTTLDDTNEDKMAFTATNIGGTTTSALYSIELYVKEIGRAHV